MNLHFEILVSPAKMMSHKCQHHFFRTEDHLFALNSLITVNVSDAFNIICINTHDEWLVLKKDINQISSKWFLSQFGTKQIQKFSPHQGISGKANHFLNQLPWSFSRSFLFIQTSNEKHYNHNQYVMITHSVPSIKSMTVIIVVNTTKVYSLFTTYQALFKVHHTIVSFNPYNIIYPWYQKGRENCTWLVAIYRCCHINIWY